MIHVDDILIRSSNVECRAYGADNILWKQTRRHEYMVVSRDKELILQSFDGKTSVAGALEKLLTQGKLESIRSFYDHVSKARELGMLVPAEENSQDRSESLPTPASTNFIAAIWVIFFFVIFGFGVKLITLQPLDIGVSPGFWIYFFVGVILSMSLSTLVAILVQSSMGSTPFNIRVNFDKILPYLSYDFRDSVVLGRWRESLVCVAGLTGPFLLLIGANVFSRYFEDDLFLGKGFLSPLIHMPGLCLAAWFSLIMITLPLGDSWGQSLIKSLFRNRHELPHEIPGVSKDNFFFGLMNFHDQMGQNRYFIAYTTYLILWLGAVFRLNTEFVAAQFNQAVSTFLLSEQFGFKLYFAAGMMLAGIILLVLMIFYVIWICGAGLIKELFIHKIITDKTQKARQDNSLENLIKKEWPDASAAKCREAAFLQGIDLFADWTPASIVHLVRRKSLEEFPENTTLISQGEANERFYIIHDGRVKVSRDHQEVAILTSGHVFGEISLIRHIPATATVTTLGHVQAYVFSRAEFLEIITRDFLTGYLLDMKSEARKGEE